MKMGIYGIINPNRGKQYIGSAVNIERRWYLHCNDLAKGKHHSPLLQRAWNKYGEDAFWFITIEEVAEKSLLLQREQYWIDRTTCYDPATGYNIAPTAGSMLGYKWSEELHAKNLVIRKRVGLSPHAREMRRKKLLAGEAKEMQKNTIEAKKRNGTTKHSDEARLKISQNQKGRKHSPES